MLTLKNDNGNTRKTWAKKEMVTINHSVDKNYNEVFKYEFIPTFDKESDDYMIRFPTAKNSDLLIGKLLMIIDRLGFNSDGTREMIDEIWINAKSANGQVNITRDIWDFVFIISEKNKTDLEKIEIEK